MFTDRCSSHCFSMYERMKTNLPKEVMAFPDFPFPADEPESFLHHSKIRKYLDDYCDRWWKP